MPEHDADDEGFVPRTARGTLAGRVDLSGDWDSAEVNEAISHDFGLTP